MRKKLKLILILVLIFIIGYNLNVRFTFQSRLNSLIIPKIDKIVTEEMKKDNIQGLSIGLITKEKGLVWAKGYGYKNIEQKKKVKSDTLYRIASVTKPFTAVGIMMLVGEEKISLDIPIEQYIPQLQLQNNYEEKLTLRHFLSHRSGIRRDIYRHNYQNYSLEDIIDLLKEHHLLNPPGTFKYSNVGYSIAGRAIEKITNKSYSEFIETRFFSPLKMKNSTVGLEREVKYKLPRSYKITSFSEKRKTFNQVPFVDKPAGGIVSNVPDMAKFIQALMNNSLLSKKLKEEMFTPQWKHRKLDPHSYGLGWYIKKNKKDVPTKVVYHPGEVDGFHSLIVILPQEGIGFFLANNTDPKGKKVNWEIVSRSLKVMSKYSIIEK